MALEASDSAGEKASSLGSGLTGIEAKNFTFIFIMTFIIYLFLKLVYYNY
jgi:hypothetical protein